MTVDSHMKVNLELSSAFSRFSPEEFGWRSSFYVISIQVPRRRLLSETVARIFYSP